MLWRVDVAVPCLLLVVVLVSASVVDEQAYDTLEDEIPSYTDTLALLRASGFIPNEHIYAKRDMDGSMPGVLRFGKRSLFDKREGVQKKEVPGVLRFGKRAFEDYEKSEPGVFRYDKRDMPGVLRFGKREMPGVLRFGKREEMPGVLRFGKRSVPGVLRFGKRAVPGVLRFGKREDIPGVLRFGKRSLNSDDVPGVLLGKKSVPGVLRFGK